MLLMFGRISQTEDNNYGIDFNLGDREDIISKN